jgi:hypothetical protein
MKETSKVSIIRMHLSALLIYGIVTMKGYTTGKTGVAIIYLEPISKPPQTRINKGENRGLEIVLN